jgi:Fe-Mn family superoxide dismutase
MNPLIFSKNSSVTRRDALKTLGAGAVLLGLGLTGGTTSRAGVVEEPKGLVRQPFVLPKLPYAYDALEPHIDVRTMEIHHSKHHQAYITNANKALEGRPELLSLSGEVLLSRLESVPEPLRTTLRNNVGGHVNHSFFWEALSPRGGGEPQGALAEAIGASFGSFDVFKAQFADAAAKRFGSGWAWLVVVDGRLSIRSTANQDSPLMEGAVPVLGLDVWEHAYYLKYQNRRAEYVAAFWNVVDWNAAGRRYAMHGS